MPCWSRACPGCKRSRHPPSSRNGRSGGSANSPATAPPTRRVINLANTSSQMVQLISKLSLAAILYFGAREVIGGALTVGGLVAFNMFAQRVSGPVIRMAQLWQDFQQVRLSIERLGDVLNTPIEPVARSRMALPEIKGEVRFERVRFRYGLEGPWTVDDIELRHARRVARSASRARRAPASRRSTKLLQRLYAPSGRAHPDRRRRHCTGRSRLAAAADRRGVAGELAVQPLDPREYRARESRNAARIR